MQPLDWRNPRCKFLELILASDKPENHTKKGKGAGISKIEGSGRNEGGDWEKTMVALLVFISATYLEITIVFEKKKKTGETTMRTFGSFKNLARE